MHLITWVRMGWYEADRLRGQQCRWYKRILRRLRIGEFRLLLLDAGIACVSSTPIKATNNPFTSHRIEFLPRSQIILCDQDLLDRRIGRYAQLRL